MKEKNNTGKQTVTEESVLIRELREENKKLRAELERYKYESTIGNSIYARHHEKSWQLSMRQSVAKKDLFERRTFASYLWGTFKNRTFFLYYLKFVDVLRKYAIVTTTLKVLLVIWTMLQSSALFVLFTGSVALSAPITILLSYIALIIAFFGREKLNKRTRRALKGKKVTVFFPSKGRPFDRTSYFREFVNSLAKDPGAAVVIVSPYYFGSRGVSALKRYYLAARFERENIILIRKHYFFTFKKNVLSDMTDSLTYIF